jgi:glycosyltransferase involved in cell wall biosynthesis
MRVLAIAEAANPEWVSVPLVGWSLVAALRRVADVHLVTHRRNAAALQRAGLNPGTDFTIIDNEALAAPLWRMAERLRGGSGKGWTTLQALAWPSYVYFEHLLWKSLGARMRAGEWDVVHRITPLSPTMPSWMAPRLAAAGVPLVVGPLNGGTPWPRQFDGARRAEREWLSYVRSAYRFLPGYSRTREHAAALVIASHATWAELPERWRGRAVYVPENGIDPNLFAARPDSPVSQPLHVTFVGRLVPYKGADMLIDGLARSLAQGRVHLHVVGDGPALPDLRVQVALAQIERAVTFHGWQSQTDVAAHLARSDLFAFPSIREFGGGVVLEAMACAVPPLVVDYGGPGELVNGECGYLISLGPRDRIVRAIAATMDQILDRPAQLRAKGAAARHRVERLFTWDVKAQQMGAIYAWVLGQGPKPDFGMPFS